MACFHVWCGFDDRYCDQCKPRGQELRDEMSAGEPRAWDSDDERRGWYAGYDAAVGEMKRNASTIPATGVVGERRCVALVQETRDHNAIRAEEKEKVGEPAHVERLIVAILDRILGAATGHAATEGEGA